METLEANPCLFPVLTNRDCGESTTALQEIRCESLLEMSKFCVENKSKIPLFLMIMWSAVLRQYTETNCVLFGINISTECTLDILDEGQAQWPQNSIQTCQVSITPETRITGLLRNQGNCIQLHDHDKEINHNTGILLTRKDENMNPAALLDGFNKLNKPGTV
jgi:hypothetical protein